MSKLLSFVGHKRGLGLHSLSFRSRLFKPRKKESGEDTYVPPVELVVEAGRRLRGGLEAYAAWLLLVSTGSRLSTIVEALRGFDKRRLVCLDTRVCRYHIDYRRSEKTQWTLYAPVEVWGWLRERLPMPGVDYEDLGERVRSTGVAAKHYKNLVFNKMVELGIPEGVADLIMAHKPSTVGRKNYLAKLAQADNWYPRYAQWLRREILKKPT